MIGDSPNTLAWKETRNDSLGVIRNEQLVSDEEFDLVYSDYARQLSDYHWTPVAVAFTAARILVRDPKSRVLDVGSGAGKFCHVGASATPGTFVGIEQRARLVEESRRVAMEHGVEGVEFIHGNAFDMDWKDYDGIYLFNPFLENVDSFCRLDDDLPLNSEIYRQSIAKVETNLRAMPKGTRVVTYHGFGGNIPRDYQPFFSCRHGGDYIRAWVKD